MRAFGLRVVQAMGLRVGDIDTGARTLKVRGELGKSKQERAGRVVPYGEALQPFLVALTAGRDPADWLVPSRRARGLREREVRTEYVSGAWGRAGVRAEVWQGRPDHAFRKGFVSELRRAGADSDAVEVLVGHSLGLRGVYTDADALPLRDAVALVPPFSAPALVVLLAAVSTENEKDGAK
jgi:integrase